MYPKVPPPNAPKLPKPPEQKEFLKIHPKTLEDKYEKIRAKVKARREKFREKNRQRKKKAGNYLQKA